MSFDPKTIGDYNELDCLRTIVGKLTGASAGSPAPVANGTYRVGLGVSQDGRITVVNGIITAVQEAQP